MSKKQRAGSLRPIYYGVLIFVLLLIITQYITYQRYLFIKETEGKELQNKLNDTKERFKTLLSHNISSVNTLAILYKQDKQLKNFNAVAKEIIRLNPHIDIIYLTDRFTVIKAYPPKGNSGVLGKNLLNDPYRKKEALLALEKKQILFAGPHELANGSGKAIAGRVPVFVNNQFIGFSIAITRLSTIDKFLRKIEDEQNKFVYQLSKVNPLTNKTEYFFEGYNPKKGTVRSVYMPEGNWKLDLAFAETYHRPSSIIMIMVLGVLLSLFVGVFVYSRSKEKALLEKMISQKTSQLAERLKDLAESETKFRSGFEHAAIGMALVAPDNKWIMVNKAICNILGYSEAEMLNLHTHEITHPDDLEKENELLRQTLAGERDFYRIEKRYIRKDGSVVWVNRTASLVRDAESQPLYFISQLENITQRKHIEEELQASETRFRGAFEYAAIGIAIVSLKGEWMRVNKALCDMLGYREEELLKLTFQEITHPDDLSNDLNFLQDTLAGKREYYRMEKRYFHKNGSIIWINLNVALIKDTSAKPLYFVSQIENITERVEAQVKFKNLVEESLVGVYIIQDQKFVYVNPRIIAESGYSEEELLSMNLEDLAYEEDVNAVKKTLDARMRGEIGTIRYEVRVKKKDGQVLWVEMFGTTTVYKGSIALIGTMVNITDKKEAYLDLEKSEANLKSIFNTTEVGFLLMDKDMNIIAFNEYYRSGYKELTGFEFKVGAHFPDLVLPSKRDMIVSSLKEVLETKTTIETERVYDNKDVTKYFSVKISPVIVNNEVVGICQSGVDISDRKNMELERQQIINDLVQRNRDLEQFTQIVSHNVRAPLSTILGLAGLIHESHTEEERQTVLDGITQSAENLDTVLRDLNEILHVKRDISELKVNVNLNELVNEVQAGLSKAIHDNHVIIRYDFSAVRELNTVRSYIHSIFYNLIANAIKYAKPGETAIINISAERENGHINLLFRDNGIGIDLDKYGDQIFGMYMRFNHSTDGKGLGLFMVKTQVAALKGSISVESAVNQGATFKVQLPA